MIDISKTSTEELLRELLRRFSPSHWADHRQLFEELASEMSPYTPYDPEDDYE